MKHYAQHTHTHTHTLDSRHKTMHTRFMDMGKYTQLDSPGNEEIIHRPTEGVR